MRKATAVMFCFLLCIVSAVAQEAKITNVSQLPIIRSIKIQVRDVFDDSDLRWLYRTANSLKATTRESIIRRELLFEQGDRFDEFVIQESERNLRSLPYIRQVTIYFALEGDYVDVVVSVQDTWTLFPQFSFAVGGGTDKTSFGVSERNVFGSGRRVETFIADDEGREKIQGVYEDNRFLDTYQRFLVGHFYRSDGYRTVGCFGRPFRSLVEPYAWGVNAEVRDLVDKMYENGDERFIFRHRHLDLSVRATIAKGDPEVLSRRYSVGVEISKDSFKEADDGDFVDVDVDPDSVVRDPDMIAEDRRLGGPFVAFRQIEPDFVSLDYVDRFERIQDFNLGAEFAAKVGIAPKIFNSSEETLLISTSRSEGFAFSSQSIVRGAVSAVSRITSGGIENANVKLEGKYFNTLGVQYVSGMFIGRHTLAGSVVLDMTYDLDKDKELLLGASNGLRGYEHRTFSGEHRLIVNFEDRVHFVDDVAKLVSIGGALFFDVGGTSNRGFGDILDDRLFSDVGVGLRFAFPRASGGSVLRIDVAFPLRDGPDGSQQFEPRLLITVGQIFSSQLSSEAPIAKQANVDIGF